MSNSQARRLERGSPASTEEFLRETARETRELEERVHNLKDLVLLRLFAMTESQSQDEVGAEIVARECWSGFPNAVSPHEFLRRVRSKAGLQGVG